MFRRFPFYALFSGILLAGCATTPEPYDPFAPNANNKVAPPQVYGGDPLSRSEFQNLTAAPRPEMPASYNQPAPLPLSNTASPVPEAYQGPPPHVPASIPDSPTPDASQADSPVPLSADPEASPLPQAGLPQRIAEKPGISEPAGSDPSGSAAVESNDLSPYGHDADYRWIRGKLEYSHVERAWKLRYAPIDVEDDPYGGSVFLGNDARLQDFHEGDVVYIEGRTLPGPTGVFSPGPRYEIERITHLEKP